MKNSKDTSLIRTIILVPMVSVLEGFRYTSLRKQEPSRSTSVTSKLLNTRSRGQQHWIMGQLCATSISRKVRPVSNFTETRRPKYRLLLELCSLASCCYALLHQTRLHFQEGSYRSSLGAPFSKAETRKDQESMEHNKTLNESRSGKTKRSKLHVVNLEFLFAQL